MKTYFKICTSAVGGLMLALATATVSAQVVGSKHDLTSTGDSQGGGTAVTDQVCVFCHTPHGADISAAVPLWNKVILVPAVYQTYADLATPSLDGLEASVGSVSLACLSCHDGTQAMDVVINAPGSGGYNAGGAEIDGSAVGPMTGVPMLDTDLRDDHPISIQYAGGGATIADADGLAPGPFGDPDFNKPYRATVNTSDPIWWVDSAVGGGTGTREKTDMILYARSDPLVDAGVIQPFVECGSCHDPHNSTPGGATPVEFLRIANTGSQICTACHIK